MFTTTSIYTTPNDSFGTSMLSKRDANWAGSRANRSLLRAATSSADVTVRRLPPSSLIFGARRFAPEQAAEHEAVLRAAHIWMHRQHTAACTASSPKYFASFAASGIGNDLNQAVRSLAIAFFRRRQLVLVPPRGHERNKLSPSTQRMLDPLHPWHWLQQAPLSAILKPSSCQTFMSEHRYISAFNALAAAPTAHTAAHVFSKLGLGALANSSLTQSFNHWRVGLDAAYIPQQFRGMGLLWWFQALTTYFIRVRKPLRQRMLAHPALAQLLAIHTASPAEAQRISHGNTTTRQHAICVTASAEHRCYGVDLLSHVAFDVGMHIRLGDACRPELRKSKTRSRTCVWNVSYAVQLLRERGHTQGTVFLATDSESIISQVAAGAAAPFTFHYLNISRSRYNTPLPNELRATDATDRTQDLVEMLLDLLLLSHSTVVVGTMQSNVPRLALQLRVEAPGTPALVSLDRREWCTRSSCRMNYTKKFGTAR